MEGDPNLVTSYGLLALAYARPEVTRDVAVATFFRLHPHSPGKRPGWVLLLIGARQSETSGRPGTDSRDQHPVFCRVLLCWGLNGSDQGVLLLATAIVSRGRLRGSPTKELSDPSSESMSRTFFLAYAQNIASGEGFVYYPRGERVEGFTSLLCVSIGHHSAIVCHIGAIALCTGLPFQWCR